MDGEVASTAAAAENGGTSSRFLLHLGLDNILSFLFFILRGPPVYAARYPAGAIFAASAKNARIPDTGDPNTRSCGHSRQGRPCGRGLVCHCTPPDFMRQLNGRALLYRGLLQGQHWRQPTMGYKELMEGDWCTDGPVLL